MSAIGKVIDFDFIERIFREAHSDEHAAQLVISNAGLRVVIASGCFQEDSLVNIYSISKAIATIVLYDVCFREGIDLDTKVSRVWPKFSGDKKDIRISNILNHTSGLPHFGVQLAPEALYDWDRIVSVLELTTPLHKAGEEYCYHARTYGFLLGEIVRRISGLSIGSYLRDFLGPKYGSGVYFGLRSLDEFSKLIPLVSADSEGYKYVKRLNNKLEEFRDSKINESRLVHTKKVFDNPFNPILMPNDPRWCVSELPSSGCISNALNIVNFFSNYMNDSTNSSTLIRSRLNLDSQTSLDQVLGFPVRWKSGFGENLGEFGSGKHRYGYRAIGGSIFFFDPTIEFYFCYTTSKMIPKVGLYPAHDPRILELLNEI